MDNPLGGITRGWTEIRSVYELLFDRANQYQFEFHDYSLRRYGGRSLLRLAASEDNFSAKTA